MKTTETIINALKQNPLSIAELHQLTGIKPSSIRGTLSRLRKRGYDIELKETIVYKYYLEETPKKKVEEWLLSNNRFGDLINYEEVAKRTKMSIEEVSLGVEALFRKYRVVQQTNTSAIIFKKET